MRHLSIFAGLALSSALTPVAAMAQTAAQQADKPYALDEIVVTASKRAETLTRAPLAVSSVSQAGLDQTGVSQAETLVTQIPSLQLAPNGFSVRGIGSSNNSDQGSATVALHVDGVYNARSQFLSLPLFDVDRVEVLRGPQGTLYGRNATAGVVNIITARPKQVFEAFGDLSYGNRDELIARAAINVPVTSTLAVRASVVRRRNDGYYTETGVGRNGGIADQWGLRATALWTPSDRFNWQLSFNYSQDKGTLAAAVPTYYGGFVDTNLGDNILGTPTAPVAIGNDPRRGTGATNGDRGIDIAEYAVRSNMDLMLNDALSLSYVAGYSLFKDEGNQFPSPTLSFLANNRATAWSHEVDLKYDQGPLKGVIGLYHYDESQRNAARLNTIGSTPAPYNNLFGVFTPSPRLAPGVTILSSSPDRTNQTKAVFGQVTYSVTDALRLTGGLRYNEDKTSNGDQFFQLCLNQPSALPNAATACNIPIAPKQNVGNLSRKFTNTSWKILADYGLAQDVLLYGSIGTGYRAGGVADRSVPAQFQAFEPEEVTNYELGIRSLLMDRRLSLNLTAFYMDYSNLQQTAVVQAGNGNQALVTTNAAAATIKGAEFEFAWQMSRADKISGFATYTDAQFDRFTNGTNSFLTPEAGFNNFLAATGRPTLPTPAFDLSGNALPSSPKWTLRGIYSHIFTLGDSGTITPTASAVWQSASYLSAINFIGDYQGDYATVDLTLRYETANRRFSAEAFAYNATDNEAKSGYGAAWGYASATYKRPRLYGLRIGFRY